MNYFPFHVGDYVSATAHLSWDEDMAYTRLIRVYYQTEKPIPAGQAYRLARAVTAAQKAAVDTVLAEFFEACPEGFRQDRCDIEIAKYSDKQTKAKRSADARWKQHKTEPNAHTEGNADAMRTHTEGNANQQPITNNQEPILRQDNSTPPSRAGAVCVVVKAAGIGSANPSHPKLLELLDDGAQVQEFEDAARKAVQVGKGFAYTLGIVKNAREDAKRQPPAASAHETFRERDDRLARERIESICPSVAAKAQRSRNVIDITPDSPTVFGAIA